MLAMKIVIIEDEKILANKLEQYILEIDESIEVLAKIGTVRDAVDWLAKNLVDLIFLDIHLSDGLSFDIFEQVHISTPVIFTTAYDQYAIKAFKNNGIDYLLKPINIKELKESIDKFKELYQHKEISNPDFHALIEVFKNKSESYKKRFTINVGSKIKIINTDDIAYFYSTNKAVFLRTINNKDYDVDYSLNKLENILDPEIFFRINRKYIIRIQSIDKLITLSKSRLLVKLNPPVAEDIIITYQRSGALKKWLNR